MNPITYNPQKTLSWKDYPEVYAILTDIPLKRLKIAATPPTAPPQTSELPKEEAV